jgi:hypothetical protein
LTAICSFCGRRNPGSAVLCGGCGGSLADARRTAFRFTWSHWLPGVLVALLWAAEFTQIHDARMRTRKRMDAEIARLDTTRVTQLADLETDYAAQEFAAEKAHQRRMANDALISGAAAQANHLEEWKGRQAHKPEFAASLLEQTLLQVEKLGRDPATRAEVALKEVARMVSPAGSRIEVTPNGERFIVRVAFRLSAVMPGEAGGGTKHTSSAELRKEVEEVSARVVKEIFDYCGSRGIERLSVSCNRALRERPSDGEERLRMRSLYRVSIDVAKASSVADWRRLSLAEVSKLLKVEHDMISTIAITQYFI